MIKVAVVKQINIHFDDITFFNFNLSIKMLFTASKDSTFKISLIEGANLNVQYVQFDSCETQISKLVLFDSWHVFSLTDGSKYGYFC